MGTDELICKLGQPDITVGALHIWIHERQFPESEDFWDGNWGNATAHCSVVVRKAQRFGSMALSCIS